MDVSESETIDQKIYLKKFRGGFSPLSSPLDLPMGLGLGQWFSTCGSFTFFLRVARASDKHIYNYFHILYFVHGTTVCRR